MPPTIEDTLWLEILKKADELKDKTPDEIREHLKEGGFPQELIENFIAQKDT